MSKRWWLFGVVVLVSIGLLVACGSNYNSSTNGLVLVGSQGSGLIETFSFGLNNGHVSAIANSPADTSNQTCVLNGLPSSIVIDRAGAYAYAIINANSSCDTQANPSKTGIAAFKINSDGTTTAVGNSLVPFTGETVMIQGTTTSLPAANVVPSTMVIDTAGKFLFVADRATTCVVTSTGCCVVTSTGCQPGNTGFFVPGAVSVFAIGSGGTLTEVAGSPFFTSSPATTTAQSSLDIISVAATPTVFPSTGINGVQGAVCSGSNPPTTEFLYAIDTLGNQVFEFQVDTSSGVLASPVSNMPIPSFTTDNVPVGVAVDPCDRFVYVSDSLTNKVSAYTICNGLATQSQIGCAIKPPDGLVEISGSPFSLSGINGAGPLVVDPNGRNVYVVGSLSNTVAALNISSVSGSLAALNPATVATGSKPTSIAIRGDDNWMFVTNYNAATVSEYSITPATGALNAEGPIQTDNYPWGVAVK